MRLLDNDVERMTGIEPALSAWEAEVLPLNYIRALEHGVKALSRLHRDASADARLERRVTSSSDFDSVTEPDTLDTCC
jgi:hypothetical protein